MKKVYYFFTVVLCILMTSCMPTKKTSTIPVATNTISSVSFSDLNLEREDYKILNTIEVSSKVTVIYKSDGTIKVTDDSGYIIETVFDPKTQTITTESSGVLRAGFLTNDYGNVDYSNPEAIARASAFSRLVSMAKEVGGDALIEPIVSTNLEEQDTKGKNRTLVYFTTASAKVVVIKTDK